MLHTLQVLQENPTRHLLFGISKKKKGYMDESGRIFVHPLHQLNPKSSFHDKLLKKLRNEDEYTSGLTSASESGINMDDISHSGKKMKRFSSLFTQGRKSQSDDSPLSEFEHVYRKTGGEINRINPLVNYIHENN